MRYTLKARLIVVPNIVVGLLATSALPAYEQASNRLSKTFAAKSVERVVVRAANIKTAIVLFDAPKGTVEISATQVGGAKGYFPSDPTWKETPPEKWGLDFVGKRYGDALVISTKNEIGYIHHHYVLDELRIRVPSGVQVDRRERTLTGDGAADTSPP